MKNKVWLPEEAMERRRQGRCCGEFRLKLEIGGRRSGWINGIRPINKVRVGSGLQPGNYVVVFV